MSELANYSIETDQSVWLSFKDGHNLRVSVNQLPRYLSPHDLQKVRRAMKLRRDFIRHHMPKTLAIAAVLGLTALAVSSGQMLAAFWQEHEQLEPTPQQREIVRNLLPAGPDPLPAPSPAAAPMGRVAGFNTARHEASSIKPVPTLTPVSKRVVKTAVSVTPISRPGIDAGMAAPSPTPIPAATPVATPAPTPQPGAVLGQATGPESTPEPTPAP
jgi:hypothetical protein